MNVILHCFLGFFFQFYFSNDILQSIIADSTIPGTLVLYSTIHSIGVEWDITGDDNHNAVCSVQYRKQGTSAYLDAHGLYRVDFETYNMLAGSILFLEANTTYEVRLVLNDLDGGSITMNRGVSTNVIPVLPSGGNTYYIEPGNGGGTGSFANPFRGIEAADAVVNPGDICLLRAGNYGGTVFFNASGEENNHIVWKSDGDGPAIFNGIRIEADHLWFEGLTIVDQQYGLRTSPPAPQNIVVTQCFFYNNHYSIFLNDGGDRWYISDNIIIGDNDPNTSNFSGEGIELNRTSNHTVCYNTISRTADGISYPHTNVDMFGNDIFDTSDDGIEFDYGHNNNRAWRNRITNSLNNGISFQPMNGAPAYVLYNQVSVLNESTLKLRTRTDRALIAHNTFVANSGPVGYGSHFLQNFEIKNNLWISIQDRYAWENGENSNTNWRTDFDFDGFDWGDFDYVFKWGSNVRLESIVEFTNLTGQETHGIQIDHAICFDSLEFSDTGGSVDSFFIQYNVLDPSCNAINAGIHLPNINDDFNGIAPDLGAYELDNPLPHYGKRSCILGINKWIGPLIGNWHASEANWSRNKIPTHCDQVLIESGNTITISAGNTGLGYTLEIEDGGVLETIGNAQLDIVTK